LLKSAGESRSGSRTLRPAWVINLSHSSLRRPPKLRFGFRFDASKSRSQPIPTSTRVVHAFASRSIMHEYPNLRQCERRICLNLPSFPRYSYRWRAKRAAKRPGGLAITREASVLSHRKGQNPQRSITGRILRAPLCSGNGLLLPDRTRVALKRRKEVGSGLLSSAITNGLERSTPPKIGGHRLALAIGLLLYGAGTLQRSWLEERLGGSEPLKAGEMVSSLGNRPSPRRGRRCPIRKQPRK